MKVFNPLIRFAGPSMIVILAGTLGILPTPMQAATADTAPSQKWFSSPDDAVKALQDAVQARDKGALGEIFGPQYGELATGDAVQDANNAAKFATLMTERCVQVKDGENKITLEVGTNDWPMPIPLVKVDGRWQFDTAAGKEEIINRHIGKDELTAIGVCRAYVAAQVQYASANLDGTGSVKYAQKFKSSPGQKDGLYWKSAANQPASPFGPLVAEAHAQGYVHQQGSGPHAFHGYYFRILTRQGAWAPGGRKDYLSLGDLTGGFALVAYPEHWDQSGIMTFVVNQSGKVYQQSLGGKTLQIAGSMKQYDPDGNWTLVPDEGVNAVSEQ
jgi:hypothetical protein